MHHPTFALSCSDQRPAAALDPTLLAFKQGGQLITRGTSPGVEPCHGTLQRRPDNLRRLCERAPPRDDRREERREGGRNKDGSRGPWLAALMPIPVETIRPRPNLTCNLQVAGRRLSFLGGCCG